MAALRLPRRSRLTTTTSSRTAWATSASSQSTSWTCRPSLRSPSGRVRRRASRSSGPTRRVRVDPPCPPLTSELTATILQGPVSNFWTTVCTEVFTSNGTPHTLEHLTFTASEQCVCVSSPATELAPAHSLASHSYPYSGILDALSNRMLSNGTNAWTAVRHALSLVLGRSPAPDSMQRATGRQHDVHVPVCV